jgi:hypothetical protein
MAIICMMPKDAMDDTIVVGLSKLMYVCEKELMEKSTIKETILELLDVKIAMLQF